MYQGPGGWRCPGLWTGERCPEGREVEQTECCVPVEVEGAHAELQPTGSRSCYTESTRRFSREDRDAFTRGCPPGQS